MFESEAFGFAQMNSKRARDNMAGYLIEMYSKNNEINNGELLSVDDLKAHAVKADKKLNR